MNENDESAEDSRLLSVAASISSGTPVDWSTVQQWPADAEESAVIAELRVLEDLSRINEPMPAAWGPFTISGEIGRGSFGTVYRALDPNLQVDVALKVIRPRFPDVSIDPSRALTEARLLAQINHPNIVKVYRADCLGNEVGLAMELVNGHSLAEVVQRQGPCSARETMLIGIDVCKALAAVHGKQLLHGDIKAHNVMRAEGGRIVVMDFGAGKDLKQEALRSRGHVTGTPLYLAPEVLAGQPPSTASDIYSLGVLLDHLATGAYPVEGTTRTQIERVHTERKPRKPLRDIRPDLPDAFIQVVNRAVAERPQDRQHSAGELEAELNRALQLSRDDTRESRVGKRWVAAAAAILGVGLGAVITYRALLPGPASDGAGAAVVAIPPSAAVPAPVPAAVESPDAYRIEAALYREHDGVEERLQPGGRVNPGDTLSLQIRASVPIHLYVVNEDEHGESYLLFPMAGQSVANPLPAEQRHRVPGVQDGEQISWQVTSPGEREHFLIFANPQPPSPAFERMFAALPRPTAGRPVSRRLSSAQLRVLRGVGGLSSAPARSDQPLRLAEDFATPLTGSEEAVRGVWVRQITLANPVK